MTRLPTHEERRRIIDAPIQSRTIGSQARYAGVHIRKPTPVYHWTLHDLGRRPKKGTVLR